MCNTVCLFVVVFYVYTTSTYLCILCINMEFNLHSFSFIFASVLNYQGTSNIKQ